jgi:hypothetical protein
MARVKQVARFRVDENGKVVPIERRPLQAACERMGFGMSNAQPIKKKDKKGKAAKEDKTDKKT